MAQYIRIAIAITVIILYGETTTAKSGGGHHRPVSQTHTNEAPGLHALDWYNELIDLLNLACLVLVCDYSLDPHTSSLESKIEWWNHLYQVGGVRKGMLDAERHRATTIVREMRIAAINAVDKIDPDLGDRFLRTLRDAEKAIAAGGELPVTGHQRPTG